MAKITDVQAREILDSRGFPTVEAEIKLEDGTLARGSAPSGASVGSYEAVELRDNDQNRRMGLGVLKAVENVNTIIKDSIVGKDAEDQKGVDDALIAADGTKNKEKLGANSILSVSTAVANACAKNKNVSLYKHLNDIAGSFGIKANSNKIPVPVFNMINGGKHGYGNLDFQEFQIVPNSDKSYSDALSVGIEIYQHLGKLLRERGAVHSVGDEGGYAPDFFTNKEAFKNIAEASTGTQYKIKEDFLYGLDIASDSFIKDQKYVIKDVSSPLTREEFMEYIEKLNVDYPLTYLEDALSEDDWEGWQALTNNFGQKMVVVGDDLLATNSSRLAQAIEKKACTAVLVKPNQVGTISETLQIIQMAKEAGMKVVISHRLGETTDTFIADLAVAVDADYMKFGAPVRGERVAKYNRLLQIESDFK